MTLIYNDADSKTTQRKGKKSHKEKHGQEPHNRPGKKTKPLKNNILHYLNFLLNYLTTFSHMKPQKIIGSKIKKYSKETEKKLKD